MFPPGYSFLTLGEARSSLAARLEDNGIAVQPPYVYWTDAELNDFIREGIRTWQALTGTYKQRATFTIEPNGGVDGSSFYDLNADLGFLNFKVTDLELVNMVMDALLEPRLTADWTGTGQFQFLNIVTALQNRINRWLTDCGANVARNFQFVQTGPTASRIFLPESVLDVRRAAWLSTVSGIYTTLWRDDEFAMQAFYNMGFAIPAEPPITWGKFVMPPVGIDIYPPPANPGDLETLVVTSGPQVGTSPADIVANPTVLDIPEDFSWGIKFGVLSDLMSADGPMRDLDRAKYAEDRYQESAQLYRISPVLIQTQINGVPIWSGSVFEMDAFLASLQSKPGAPEYAGMCDRNLVAFGPTPDRIYSVTMDVVCNIPVPQADSDFIQMDRGALNSLLDYCEHLAAYKMAGLEFHNTDKTRQNFYMAAALENSRITKQNFYRSALQLPVLRQQGEVPRI